VYDRRYEHLTLNFEASGGLLHNSLVLRDKETDSYWSLMKGQSIAGELSETPLKELAVGRKLPWREWVEMYPETLVLSVNGQEDDPVDPYQQYSESEDGFAGRIASDRRLATKEPIFGFVLSGDPFAVAQSTVEGGVVFQVLNQFVFLYRPPDSHIHRSTVAYLSSSSGFGRAEDRWVHLGSSSSFDTGRGVFEPEVTTDLRRMEGFDTYWYTWSPLHPRTKILAP